MGSNPIGCTKSLLFDSIFTGITSFNPLTCCKNYGFLTLST